MEDQSELFNILFKLRQTMTKEKKEVFKCTLISCIVSIPHLDLCFFMLNSKGREVIIITYQRFNIDEIR